MIKRIILLCSFMISCVSAQTPPSGVMVSPNLVNPTMGTYTTITGVTNITAPQGYSGGSTPGYISSQNSIAFGYVTGTAAYKYAFNTALQNSGMSFLGYNYSWDYLNQDTSRGTLSASVIFDGVNGSNLYTKNWTLPKTTDGWTTVKGTESFSPAMLSSSVSSIRMTFTGKDDRYWAGYYGPQVKNASLTLNYTFDSCSVNPLSSSNCPGYAQAYHDQQCSINTLYMSDCPGYAQAYYNQQCSINALYDRGCPGYAAAYHNQQCSINPLYMTDCSGYQQAYYKQQCSANP